jgi:hypothetical protein
MPWCQRLICTDGASDGDCVARGRQRCAETASIIANAQRALQIDPANANVIARDLEPETYQAVDAIMINLIGS